ncbi:hypothetical protein Tco_1004621 [Tanacetum coccineum]|uniref:Reverse transcriptase domain-containing protein n=1 Tax=Tanacetum coccineum TaxID=301880 RepID=A0ABQ5FDP9_9ASTR
MWKITIAFLRGEVAAGNQERKKTFPPWKQQDARHRQNFKKRGFKNQQRSEKRQDRFTLLTKTPKEILALDKGKFKPPPPMTTPVEKRNASNFCEFHGEGKPSKGGKEGRSRRKGQATSNPNGTVGTEDIQTKDHPNILSGDNDLVPTLRGRRWNGRPIVIEAEVGGHIVHRIYVDGGASSEIPYENSFQPTPPRIRNQMVPATTYLVGFSGEIIWPLEQVSLLVKICDEEHSTSAWMNFMVDHTAGVRNDLRAQNAAACGFTLTEEGRKKLCSLLRQNLDIFARKPADMTRVPRHIAEHRLNVREGCFPVRQKKKGQAPARNKAICEEVEKLVNVDIMKEVHYDSWLSNPVMVKKHDNSRRM